MLRYAMLKNCWMAGGEGGRTHRKTLYCRQAKQEPKKNLPTLQFGHSTHVFVRERQATQEGNEHSTSLLLLLLLSFLFCVGGSAGAYGALSSGYQSLAARQADTSVILSSLFGGSFLADLTCARQCVVVVDVVAANTCRTTTISALRALGWKDVRCAAGKHASKWSHKRQWVRLPMGLRECVCVCVGIFYYSFIV